MTSFIIVWYVWQIRYTIYELEIFPNDSDKKDSDKEI